jgi:hypothetical protein
MHACPKSYRLQTTTIPYASRTTSLPYSAQTSWRMILIHQLVARGKVRILNLFKVKKKGLNFEVYGRSTPWPYVSGGSAVIVRAIYNIYKSHPH